MGIFFFLQFLRRTVGGDLFVCFFYFYNFYVESYHNYQIYLDCTYFT